MTPTLPPLPEPEMRAFVDGGSGLWVEGGPSGEPFFDSTQTQAYARAAIAAHLESIRPEVMRLADEMASNMALLTSRAMEDMPITEHLDAHQAARAALATLLGGCAMTARESIAALEAALWGIGTAHDGHYIATKEAWDKFVEAAANPAAIRSVLARVRELEAMLQSLTELEADGKHAGESSIEAWERARAALKGEA